jgi:catechol 2,3-dioxygenase-like lactoylglutathione lyase family enzyme
MNGVATARGAAVAKDDMQQAEFELFQVGLNTSDMAASLRFYAEVFGFANGGGQAGWGEGMRLQGLEPAGQALVWWMVAAQPRMQFELFHHTGPVQRPQPSDWSPADHGWVRIGLSVNRFDHVLNRLNGAGIALLGRTTSASGPRRIALRDPFTRIVIEVWEDGPGVPGYPRERVHGLDPAILYATSSVADLSAARRFYGEIVGLRILPLEKLHRPEDEALWGLPGARRQGFLAAAGDAVLEVVEYESPRGKPKRSDYRFSDQGIMNVALFARSTQTIQAVIDRLDAEKRPPRSLIVGAQMLGTYVLERDREVELTSFPPEMEPFIGFQPMPFLGVAPEGIPAAEGIRIVHRLDEANAPERGH